MAGRFRSESRGMGDYPSMRHPDTPDQPAIELIGRTLYFGGIDMFDGSGQRLVIQAITPSGFAGTWAYEGGIVHVIDTVRGRFLKDPGGHFCALRQREHASRGRGA